MTQNHDRRMLIRRQLGLKRNHGHKLTLPMISPSNQHMRLQCHTVASLGNSVAVAWLLWHQRQPTCHA